MKTPPFTLSDDIIPILGTEVIRSSPIGSPQHDRRASDIQLDLFGDYKSNVALYPEWQAYLRDNQPPVLAVWGKNDPFFAPVGAEAFLRDVPNADVKFIDAGHFPLETHLTEIASEIDAFLSRVLTD